MIRLLLLCLLILPSASAWAHMGHAGVRQIRFPDNRPEAVWLVVQNVGLLVPDGGDYRWLCDEAITTKPGFNDLVPLDAEGAIWVAATRFGLFRTVDAGCSFEPTEGLLSRHQIAAISPHPDVPGEAILFTETTTLDDDVFITEDAGDTWTPAGLNLLWPLHVLVRSPADPRRIYGVHRNGAVRSDDGGRSFRPIAHAPNGDDVSARDVRVLTTAPDDADVVYGSIDRLPESTLIRSRDGGETWSSLAQLEEVPDSLVISARDGTMLLTLPFGGLRRSTDGGETWASRPLLEANQSASCLFTGPDDQVWACAIGGSQFIIQSPDFGETWTPAFARDFKQVTGGWGCGEETATAIACASACDRATEDCGETPGPEAAPAEPPSMSTDAGAAQDGGASEPTGHVDAIVGDPSDVVGPGDGGDGGCQQGQNGPSPWLWGLGLVCLFRHRRCASGRRL